MRHDGVGTRRGGRDVWQLVRRAAWLLELATKAESQGGDCYNAGQLLIDESDATYNQALALAGRPVHQLYRQACRRRADIREAKRQKLARFLSGVVRGGR